MNLKRLFNALAMTNGNMDYESRITGACNDLLVKFFLHNKKRAWGALKLFVHCTNYAILETFFAKREILRAARFFGITLPADFIILLSALRAAAVAAALSPDSIATKAFLVAVLTALRRAVFTAFFLAVTKILFSDDL